MENKLRDKLQLVLESYPPFANNDWWVDQFDNDYVALCTFSYNMVTDVECEKIAKKVKETLVNNNIKLNLVFVGPFFWEWDKLHYKKERIKSE